MPAFLSHEGDHLAVKLGGMKGPEFSDALARVKSVPGRRFNPATKAWEFPADADTALRLMQMLEPVASAEVQAMVRQHTADVAEALVTKLPEDAGLQWPNAKLLRPYQRSAVNFLVEHPRSILADEMGLGKTVEAIVTVEEAFARRESHAQRVLVVCPNSMTGTWADEVLQWTGLGYQIIDGKTPAKRREQVENFDVPYVIVNWEKLRLMPELAKVEWDAVIADEAHRAKNRKAQQTKALWKITAPIQLALTGTPIMNSPDELWAILKWLRPEQYTAYWPFYYSYVDDYETRYGRIITGVRNPDQLRFELADKLVRRMKSDVLADLPPKTVQRVPVELKPGQRRLYEAAEKEFLLDIEAAIEGAHTPDAKATPKLLRDLAETGDFKRLQYLIPNGAARVTRLRQIASSPALLGGPDESAKMDAAVELIRDNPGKPFVCFTWFKDSARILADRLRKGKPALRVDTIAGDDDPHPVVEAFQAGELDVVVCTIAKGGVGLTMTRASTAIFLERDWTPAINEQAEDRLHRIGQNEAVSIVVLEARNTVDDGRIRQANALKKMISDQVLGA